MNNLHKRYLLFLFGCLPMRLLLVYATYKIPLDYLPYVGVAALIPAIAFLTIFLYIPRDTGIETFGEKIWWNNLRPIHAFLFATFSILAFQKNRNAWIVLMIDVILGLFMFTAHHLNSDCHF